MPVAPNQSRHEPSKLWEKFTLAHACSIINGSSKNKDEWKSQKNILFMSFTNLLKRWTVSHIFTCNVWPLSTENQKIFKKSLKPSSQNSKNICISLDLKKLNFLSNVLLAEVNLKFQNFYISLDTKWLIENVWLCVKQYIEDALYRMWHSLWKYFWTVVSNLDLFTVGSLSIPKRKLNIRRYLGLFFVIIPN